MSLPDAAPRSMRDALSNIAVDLSTIPPIELSGTCVQWKPYGLAPVQNVIDTAHVLMMQAINILGDGSDHFSQQQWGAFQQLQMALGLVEAIAS